MARFILYKTYMKQISGHVVASRIKNICKVVQESFTRPATNDNISNHNGFPLKNNPRLTTN